MYSIDTEIRYKIYDIYGGNESYWLSNMDEVKKTLKEMIYRYVGRRPIHDNDLLSYIKFNLNGEKEACYIYSPDLEFYTYCYDRIFIIMDNYGRMIPPNKLPNVYYDYGKQKYRFKESNKNKAADLISNFHFSHKRKRGSSHSAAMLRRRLIEENDDQINEYKNEYPIKARKQKVEGYYQDLTTSKRTWISRSWKDQTKYRCQWMAKAYRKGKSDSDIKYQKLEKELFAPFL